MRNARGTVPMLVATAGPMIPGTASRSTAKTMLECTAPSAAAAGGVVIPYHDATSGELKWAESTSDPYHQNWRIYTVDRGVFSAVTGQCTSLALPQWGTPRISYHASDPNGAAVSGDLWHATSRSGSNCNPGGTWTCIPVSASADVGRFASLCVGCGNRLHMAYYDATNQAHYHAVDVDSEGSCGAVEFTRCDETDTMPALYRPLVDAHDSTQKSHSLAGQRLAAPLLLSPGISHGVPSL